MRDGVRVLLAGLLGFLMALAFVITGSTVSTLTHK